MASNKIDIHPWMAKIIIDIKSKHGVKSNQKAIEKALELLDQNKLV